jgi:uncharacterized phage protein (TIGR02216 family)
MRLALGKMNLRPNDFWNMSFQEFYMAVDGFAEFHSGGKPPPLSRGELEDMMERYPD